MSDTVGAHNDLHSEQGARPRRTSGAIPQSGDQGARHRLAGVREAGPDSRRGVRPRVRLQHRLAHAGRAASARHRRRGAVRDPAARGRGRGSSVPRSRRTTKPTCCGWPRRRAHGRGRCPKLIGGMSVDLVDPSGIPVHVVAGTHDLRELPRRSAHTFNFGHELRRANATQRPPRVPAKVQRLGHVVLQTTKYIEALELVSRQPRDDRQRLPLLPRPA